jgi:hypothetical protein
MVIGEGQGHHLKKKHLMLLTTIGSVVDFFFTSDEVSIIVIMYILFLTRELKKLQKYFEKVGVFLSSFSRLPTIYQIEFSLWCNCGQS